MTEPTLPGQDAPDGHRSTEPPDPPPAAQPPPAPREDNARLESLMADVPPSSPGWSAPASRTPDVALWAGVSAIVIGLAVVLDMALVRQGQRSIVAGGIVFVVLLAGIALAVVAIVAGLRVRSEARGDDSARARAAIAIGLAAIGLLLMTLAGVELYAIGIDAF